MIDTRFRGPLLIGLVLALMLTWEQPLLAQRDTGTITVRVLGPGDLPLPGVIAVARGPVGTQTQYTGVDGSARFPGLYPGTGYSVTFTMNGFKTVVREALIVRAGQTTSVSELTMELASIEETVTVTGESPILDVRSTNVGGAYTDDMIDKAPTASGLWAGVLDHIPGIVPADFDVGGSSADFQTGMYAYGSQTAHNSYSVNGVETTDLSATGGSMGYYSIASFEEVGVSVASHDIETKTPGINIDMVIKSGSNDWRGGVRYFYEGESMVADNVDEDLAAQGVTEGNPTELLSDLDLQGGGPIVHDRAWFFADWWDFDLHRVRLGLEERDKTKLRDLTVNVNAQVSDAHKVSGRFLASRKYKNDRDATRFRPFLGRIQDGWGYYPQLQWQSVLSQNTFLDVRYGGQRVDWWVEARDPASSNPLPGYVDRPPRWDFSIGDYLPRPSNPTSEVFYGRDGDSLHGSLSWYRTGERQSHDLKFGGNYRSFGEFSPLRFPNGYRSYVRSSRVGSQTYDPDNNPNWADGVPVEVRLYNTGVLDIFDDGWKPDNATLLRTHAFAAYLQDTATFGNLTVTAGLRFDYAANWNPAQNRIDSYWANETSGLDCPECFRAGSFAGQDNSVTWSNLVPRIGVVYDIEGDGTWALKFNYSRYAEALGIDEARNNNLNSWGQEDWNWFDPNGDGVFQFGEQATFRDAVFPGITAGIDPDFSSPLMNEFTAGVEHELTDNILLSFTGLYRTLENNFWDVDVGRPFGPMFDTAACQRNCTPTLPWGVDPWYPVETVDPGNDGIIGTPDDGGPVTVWAVDPATFGTSFIVTANQQDYGFESSREFYGFSVVLHKRWATNWQMLAAYDYGRTFRTNGGPTPNDVYNRRRSEDYLRNQPHVFKVTANYLFAAPVGVNLGIFVRAMSGEPLYTDYYYDNEVLEPPNSPYCCQSNTRIFLTATGEGDPSLDRDSHEAAVALVDLRAEKQVTIGRYGVLHLYADVFNVFNANTVYWTHSSAGPRYRDIGGILPPRVLRLGGAWDF